MPPRTRTNSSDKPKRGGDAIQEPSAKRHTRTSARIVVESKTVATAAVFATQKYPDTESPFQDSSSGKIQAITPLSSANYNRTPGPIRRLQHQVAAPPTGIPLPAQVPNIFHFPKHAYVACQCNQAGAKAPIVPCAGRCISADHIHNYGWEYKVLLKEAENREFDSPQKAYGKDPLEPLVSSGIVPKPALRTREQSEWASYDSINWDTHEYMDRQPDLNIKMRVILIDWIVELVEEYTLSEYTYHLAITLIDKVLACTTSDLGRTDANFFVAREMLQCLGCACTWIAAKMEEVEPPCVDDFVYISDNIYTAGQIRGIELDVVTTLKFRLNHVTPYSFVHEYLLASEQSSRGSSGFPFGPAFHPIMRHMVDYLMELSRFPHEFVDVKPSLIAAAVIFLARATLGIRGKADDGVHEKGYWTKTLQFYTGYSVEELKDTVLILLTYHQSAEEESLNAIYKKFSKAKFMHVSTKTVLCNDVLDLDDFVSTVSLS